MRNSEIGLRPWRLEDAQWYADTVRGDALIQKFTTESPAISDDEARTAIVAMLAGRPGRDSFVITPPWGGNTRWGSIAVSYADGIGAISGWLAEPVRSKGTGVKAARLFSAWAFAARGLRELRWWTHPDNAAARAVAERVGYVRTPALDVPPDPGRTGSPTLAYVLRAPEPPPASDVAETIPFRWNLVRSDQLGGLINGVPPPTLRFLPDLVECAGKVIARSGGGRLVFVGRSADSIFDLLSGAYDATPWAHDLQRLAFSFRGDVDRLPATTVAHARALLTEAGITPAQLATAAESVTFVDLVHDGFTFTSLFDLLRPWVDAERVPWNAVRRALRFVGITSRRQTSPTTWRWHQHAAWPTKLPAAATRNVSIDPAAWDYLGNQQPKLTRSFHSGLWGTPDARDPLRDDTIRIALAEAVAIVHYGRQPSTRRAIVQAMHREPALAESWLRARITSLR